MQKKDYRCLSCHRIIGITYEKTKDGRIKASYVGGYWYKCKLLCHSCMVEEKEKVKAASKNQLKFNFIN